MRKLIAILISILLSTTAFAGDLVLERYSISSDSLGYYVSGSIRNDTKRKCNTACVNFSLYSSIAKDKFLGSVVACEYGLLDGARWAFKTTHVRTDTIPSELEVNRLDCN